MLTRKKKDLQRKIRAEGKNNDNNSQKQSKIIEMIKELNEDGKRRIETAQMIAKAKYIKEGQKSTKYFFNLKKDKKNPSIIKALQNKNGKIINNTNKMCSIATKYHQSLQKAPERQDEDDQKINETLKNITNKLKTDDQEKLDRQTDEYEIRKAIKASQNGKAPGINGIPYEFYKIWMKEHKDYKDKEGSKNPKKPTADITKILKEVYNKIENIGLKNQNFILGTMFLLYKKKEKTKIENYRPITLTNTDYKILTKMITTKLRKLAHKIIHPNQAGFIPKRGLYDYTRITEAMIHFCETYEKDGYIMALDQEKAYDKIAHDYLWKTLEQFNFPQKFIFKIKELYKNARTIVSVNKTLPEAIRIERGVRQGCPMSCLLYNIAIEPLAEMIRRSTLKGFRIKGIQERTLVSLFADDTLVYMNKTDKKQILENIINIFCKASTAKFNKEKTEILPVGSEKYRKLVIAKRQTSESEQDKISEEIRIVKDRKALRTLGSYMGNKTNQMTQ